MYFHQSTWCKWIHPHPYVGCTILPLMHCNWMKVCLRIDSVTGLVCYNVTTLWTSDTTLLFDDIAFEYNVHCTLSKTIIVDIYTDSAMDWMEISSTNVTKQNTIEKQDLTTRLINCFCCYLDCGRVLLMKMYIALAGLSVSLCLKIHMNCATVTSYGTRNLCLSKSVKFEFGAFCTTTGTRSGYLDNICLDSFLRWSNYESCH